MKNILSLIKKIFIPESIGSYFVTPEKILSVEIGKNFIKAALIKAHGNKRIILNLIEKEIIFDLNSTPKDDTIKTLHELVSGIKFDKLYAIFPSNQVVFKELNLPITGYKKLKLIVPFEIESQLPFPLDQAVMDTVIINENKQTKTSEVFVAAIRTNNLQDFVDLFTHAGLYIDKISIDVFELYGLYRFLNPVSTINIDNKSGGSEITKNRFNLKDIFSKISFKKNNLKNINELETINNKNISDNSNNANLESSLNKALVDIGLDSTKIIILGDNKLAYIRTLNKGLTDIAKKMPLGSANSDISLKDRIDYIFKTGVESSELEKNLLTELINDINFTLTSYSSRLDSSKKLNSIILVGDSVDIPGIKDLINNITKVDCTLLEANKIIQNNDIESKVQKLNNGFIECIASSLILPFTRNFNLQKISTNNKELDLIYAQILSTLIIAGIILSSFSLYGYLKVRNLKQNYNQTETDIINQLQKSFELKKGKISLDNAIKDANKTLQVQETAWKNLSDKNRYSLLRYLAELSKCINLKDTQLDLSQLNITIADKPGEQDAIQLYGQVNNYAQLTKLENELKCPIFKKVPRLHELNFKQNPISLTANQDEA